MKNITIAGAGVMGSQISWQSAVHGFEVIVYDAFENGLEKGKEHHRKYADEFVSRELISEVEAEAALKRISYTTDMEKAFANTDLVNESVPEDPQIKMDFWKKASAIAGPDTVLTTNSSSFTPSDLVEVITHPERFLALHFWSGIWDNNIGEVMGHEDTAPEYFSEVMNFAEAIGMAVIPVRKEQPGYVTNSLLFPWLVSALKLYYSGVADYKDIDKVWKIPNGGAEAIGPFGFMDTFGLNVCYMMAVKIGQQDKEMEEIAHKLKEEYLDQGKLGVLSGEGFYTYPKPEYLEPEFMQ